MLYNNLVHDLPVLWRNCWLVPMHIHKLPFKQVEKTVVSSLGATFLRKKTHTWSQSINQILCHRTHFYLSQLKVRMLVCKRSLKLLVSEYLFLGINDMSIFSIPNFVKRRLHVCRYPVSHNYKEATWPVVLIKTQLYPPPGCGCGREAPTIMSNCQLM